MSIKKQWLIILMFVAVFSVLINSFILSILTNQYFKNYMKDNYEDHFNQILQYTTNTLKSENYSVNQMKIELETHLVDPITRIKVYDEQGNLLIDAGINEEVPMGNGMMKGMMRRMMNSQSEEVDHADIFDGDHRIGQINITKYSSPEDSVTTRKFQSTLIQNSIYSIGIVLSFSIIIGILASRKMSKDLINTAAMAQNIEVGNDSKMPFSKVKEIRVIQQSLESLSSKLKLKQKSRKTLIDEMVHQTRTPLTIMKTHLEGIEDGVIDMTPEEIKVCENQVENITAIITNLSNLIDAEQPDSVVHVEEFELSQLIRQIVNGLKVQFEKKGIELKLSELPKAVIRSDQYKLSQAIYNIVTNAYKFTRQGGKVTLSYQIASNTIILSIEDNGQGIREEDLGRIFDAYYKGSRNGNDQGEGIGLYVAKENMERIQGSIRVESKPGYGSKFILTVPRNYSGCEERTSM